MAGPTLGELPKILVHGGGKGQLLNTNADNIAQEIARAQSIHNEHEHGKSV